MRSWTELSQFSIFYLLFDVIFTAVRQEVNNLESSIVVQKLGVLGRMRI